ncbi:hypothetical protein ACYZTX_29030 [Pseudomonas sp. MDT1-17]
MAYAYHDPAQVTVSVRHLGSDPVVNLNHAPTIVLARHGAVHLACLEFAGVLHAPDHANYVQLQLANSQALGAHLLEDERTLRGSGWLLLQIEHGDWGLLR